MQGVLSGANAVDLSGTRGNGPFRDFRGVILHVNVGDTPPSFYAANEVCPNFQVHFDGRVDQLLPLNWQPWCQSDGNTNYAAIETSGYPADPLTEAQVQSCAVIIRQYIEQMGMAPQLAETPGARGFGWHGMGGNAWGGHPGCPGEPRKSQRARILSLATGGQGALGTGSPIGSPQEEDDMTPDECKAAVLAALNEATPTGMHNWAESHLLMYDVLHDLRFNGVSQGQETVGGTIKATLALLQAVFNLENASTDAIVTAVIAHLLAGSSDPAAIKSAVVAGVKQALTEGTKS
jgi:hypothetical protein